MLFLEQIFSIHTHVILIREITAYEFWHLPESFFVVVALKTEEQ